MVKGIGEIERRRDREREASRGIEGNGGGNGVVEGWCDDGVRSWMGEAMGRYCDGGVR